MTRRVWVRRSSGCADRVGLVAELGDLASPRRVACPMSSRLLDLGDVVMTAELPAMRSWCRGGMPWTQPTFSVKLIDLAVKHDHFAPQGGAHVDPRVHRAGITATPPAAKAPARFPGTVVDRRNRWFRGTVTLTNEATRRPHGRRGAQGGFTFRPSRRILHRKDRADRLPHPRAEKERLNAAGGRRGDVKGTWPSSEVSRSSPKGRPAKRRTATTRAAHLTRFEDPEPRARRRNLMRCCPAAHEADIEALGEVRVADPQTGGRGSTGKRSP